MARLSNGLIVTGLLLLLYGAGWQLGLAPGSQVTLPEPLALQQTTPVPAAPVEAPVAETAVEQAASIDVPTLVPVTPPLVPIEPADAAEREAVAGAPPPGLAVRIAIPSVKIDTRVKQAAVVLDRTGKPVWETLPFVAVHYGSLTGLIGARGNAVIAGHVATLNEGNVFWFLYQLELQDLIQVWDDGSREHDYRVTDVELVPPTDTAIMAPTIDETLTLITCGGTFDPGKREFSKRLVVTAKPASSQDRLDE